MNTRLEEFKRSIEGKRIAVLGMGISNRPLIKFLLQTDVQITAFDRRTAEELEQELEELEGLNIQYSLGKDYLCNLKGFDIVFRTPGMRYDLPELLRAREEGAEITSEMEVFFELCPAKIIAVTGSDGKTTTTTLIYKMLEESGYHCWLGGNIGTPLLNRIEEIKETDLVVLELSSFQLQTMKRSPHIAVVTNVSPNHLDVHKSMEEYVEAKKNIFKFQSQSDKVILNYDNPVTREFASQTAGQVLFFSRKNALDRGLVLKDGWLTNKDRDRELKLVKSEEIAIPGEHNVENYLAAAAAVSDYVKLEAVARVAKTFKGVEHRIEFVREIGGVRFYNDSIASSPTRAIAGLNSFNQKVILIAGGKDKNIPYDILGQAIAEKVKVLILIGQTALKIKAALKAEIEKTGKGKDIPVVECNSYEEIVSTAYRLAEPGDVVLFSPASTSFDMFKNFEERGNRFKELVNKL
ncbi:MAG: UDP-N-acetylmuramoyl-L-alanine--D-glutamate ligase [Clostridiales bacterium]|nr:UDP-N-acetylmuramoyl-L-alanine--D-glutamate ligase [Eubacteriales bacterium]MDH7565062.1 UDP-N-acetylmuramoyl-L-alanine--D-glutamate ligase [Clostridiales bacterium]